MTEEKTTDANDEMAKYLLAVKQHLVDEYGATVTSSSDRPTAAEMIRREEEVSRWSDRKVVVCFSSREAMRDELTRRRIEGGSEWDKEKLDALFDALDYTSSDPILDERGVVIAGADQMRVVEPINGEWFTDINVDVPHYPMPIQTLGINRQRRAEEQLWARDAWRELMDDVGMTGDDDTRVEYKASIASKRIRREARELLELRATARGIELARVDVKIDRFQKKHRMLIGTAYSYTPEGA